MIGNHKMMLNLIFEMNFFFVVDLKGNAQCTYENLSYTANDSQNHTKISLWQMTSSANDTTTYAAFFSPVQSSLLRCFPIGNYK